MTTQPQPLVDPDSVDWQQHGLCRRLPGITLDDFYYEGMFRGSSENMERHVSRLKAICAVCPVQRECDDHAERTHEPGFWGGITEEERRLRKRNRQAARRRARKRRLVLVSAE